MKRPRVSVRERECVRGRWSAVSYRSVRSERRRHGSETWQSPCARRASMPRVRVCRAHALSCSRSSPLSLRFVARRYGARAATVERSRRPRTPAHSTALSIGPYRACATGPLCCCMAGMAEMLSAPSMAPINCSVSATTSFVDALRTDGRQAAELAGGQSTSAGGQSTSKVKRVPQFGRVSSWSSVPMAVASLRQIASPRPELEK